MNWSFVKLIDCNKKYFKPLEYKWLLKINSIPTLLIYEMETSGKFAEALNNLIHSSEYASLTKDNTTNNGHIKNPIAFATYIILACKGDSALHTITNLSQNAYIAKQKLLIDYGSLYIQSTGSFFPPSPSHKIIQEKECQQLVFPNDGEIRFLRWPNGKHWYLKIGDIDIKVNGENKWNSKEQAEKALKTFLEKQTT